MNSRSHLLWPLGKVLYHMAFVSPFSGKNSRTDRSYSLWGCLKGIRDTLGNQSLGKPWCCFCVQGSIRGEVLTGMAGLGELTSVNILTDSELWHCLFS